MIIVIDGPAGTGKSTVAKGVAKTLGFTFFDTGAMYRSFAWQVLDRGIDPADPVGVSALLASFSFEIRTNPNGERSYFVGNEDVSEKIRTRFVSTAASQIATYPDVRKAFVKMQRKFGNCCNAVFEGRDMGTVVFPNADIKIFLTARPTVRAERRYRELLIKFPDLSSNLNQEQILQEIEQRDLNDATRLVSPLKQAADAILIDTSDCTVDEVIEKIVKLIPKAKKRFAPMKFSYRFVYFWARLFFKICFGLRIYGIQHFRPGAGLIIANHCSFYDPPVLSISCPEEVHFLAKGSLFRIPVLGWLIRLLNTHPVSRDATDIHVLREMIQLLTEGKKLIVFPEGKRSSDGALQPLERGFSFLAQKSKCTVFPAYLSGTHRAWPVQKKWPRIFGKISCVFGSPIEWEDFEGLPKKEAEQLFTKKCEQSIRDLQIWFEQGARGNPP